ncbi:MAG: B12-binding domain-containing radical SAM protein [Proteobacteria bacterium]|nr:B12-binding domain-containing radical SAM protein [Pseudomonadota bacterium]MBU1388912.1 B12-binding domain-containing radical SAM protein [Pseudomonadota bacterium]MBU1543464.1 B12-binding domain-containing radical SAM protein [Pseudomonadota bacterium]MBU2430274.1 B12-binding domain-containing radical SAM protein [Pseudomonadota bacterium]
MKKLVLAYPNQRWKKTDANTNWDLSPSMLCLLAAMVKDIVEVQIIDAHFYNLSIEEFKKQLIEGDPDYVGISVLTTEYAEILDTAAAAIKETNPDIIIIAGGVHVTMEYKRVMENTDIDFAVRGEGEYVLRDLLQYLVYNKTFPENGLVYRKNGNIIAQNQAFVSDLDSLPWPDYELIKFEDYINKGPRIGPHRPPAYPYLMIAGTRGCPFGCSFCQVETISGRKVRHRNPEDFINELIFLKERYGIKSIIFVDDNIVMAKKFFVRVLELFIEKELNMQFIIGAFAIFLLTDELLELMAKAGCVGVNVAIESGNDRILKEVIHKPVNLEDAKKMIGMIKRKGLFCLANFIIGFPGETWAEIRETIHYAEICGADYVKIFVAVPLNGTKMRDIAVELGVLPDKNNINVDWRYAQIVSDEWTSRDVSILRVYEWDRINFSSPERRKRTAELWGIDELGMEKIRKETRDALTFESISAQV